MVAMNSDQVLTVTDPARGVILEARADEVGADALALWLEVSGEGVGKFNYDMYFQALADAKPGDWVEDFGQFSVIIPAASVSKLRGATLDSATDGSGMVIVNPNEPKSPVMANFDSTNLEGPVAERILQVLEQSINPQIASHGGFAELVAVEDDTAYLRMGGGCQGCGMAKTTMSQGIEVAIKEAVPEILRVVDVTDHAGGSNPYYQAAKK